MYEAKRGRRGFLLFAPAMDEEGDDRLRLQVDLDHAIQHGELVLHYQPKIDLVTGKLSGAEALVRWQHPVLGMLPPARFVPLAERTHLIGPLTFHVLRLAATQARAWAEQGRPLPIAVNVSAINLDDGGFVDSVDHILKDVGVAAGLIELEVTETTLMRDPERARAAIQALNELGVRVAIDDFGTGYSSMTYLRKLAVAKIKIDKSFVMDMSVSRNDNVIVRSIIDLGHSLGLKVVGEGVETADTMAVLASLGCDYAQGFHLARPMSAEAFEAWWQQNL
jgi:EAL domain-containing protein (putative c-di-GMP-specific phosphodiesterase class I)